MVVGVGNGVLFREVSSVQGCPYRERFHCIYMYHAVIIASYIAHTDAKDHVCPYIILLVLYVHAMW